MNPWWLVFFLISLEVQAVAEPATSSWKNKPKKKKCLTLWKEFKMLQHRNNMTAEMHNFRLTIIITISQTNQSRRHTSWPLALPWETHQKRSGSSPHHRDAPS